MITIPIQVSGDVWNNRLEVEKILKTLNPGAEIMLDAHSEGASLRHLGVVELFEQYNFNVSITRWSNGVETVPFRRHFCNSQSHFYPMAIHYWSEEKYNDPCAEFQFGLFLGRSTTERDCILYDAFHRWPDRFLLSKMPNLHDKLQKLNSNDTVENWINTCPVSSLQGYTIQDQYKIPELSTGQMMSTLIKDHYPRFNIELVCETYTLGDTFFPTEKTVRPIVGNKPFIVYGPKGFLSNLRSTERFRTFGDLWDESYDQFEGRRRWDAICYLIDQLSALPESQWIEIIHRASVITNHNRSILKKIIDDRKKL